MDPANFLALACETVAGEFYFTVECPVSGKPIPFERDPDRGRKLYGNPVLLMVGCPHCRVTHTIERPIVLPFEVARKGTEYRRLGRQLIPVEQR